MLALKKEEKKEGVKHINSFFLIYLGFGVWTVSEIINLIQFILFHKEKIQAIDINWRFNVSKEVDNEEKKIFFSWSPHLIEICNKIS